MVILVRRLRLAQLTMQDACMMRQIFRSEYLGLLSLSCDKRKLFGLMNLGGRWYVTFE